MGRKSKDIRPIVAAPPATPVLQVMPKRKVRLDPTIVPHLAAWLTASCQQHQAALDAPRDETTALGIAARNRQDEYHDHAVSAIEDVIARLYESQPIERIEDAQAHIQMALDIKALMPKLGGKHSKRILTLS